MFSIFLFTGENTYQLANQVKEWKQQFFMKHGEDNYTQLSAKNLSLDILLDAISFPPFLAEKRLVLVDGIPRFEKEAFAVISENCAESTVLLFIESKPDKRISFNQLLLKHATVKEYPHLPPAQLKTWIQKRCLDGGATIDSRATDALLSTVGTDQWILASEIDKLILSSEGSITADLIADTVSPGGEQVVWTLTNLLSAKKGCEAYFFLRSLFDRGHDPYSLWGILLHFVKQVTLVHAATHSSSLSSSKDIADATGVAPFSLRTLQPFASSLSATHVANLVETMYVYDKHLKTGGYTVTSAHQYEFQLILERLIEKIVS